MELVVRNARHTAQRVRGYRGIFRVRRIAASYPISVLASGHYTFDRTSMDHYDVIVIGSGPGGASLARKLASTGKSILLLERGDYLKREPANWDSKTVFVDSAYQTKEIWYGSDGRKFHPGLHYYVGGNSKVYGAALFRLRERDFDEITHKDGISPAWPLKYADFEPYYGEAERLWFCRVKGGEVVFEADRYALAGQ